MKTKTKFIYSAFAVFAFTWLALSPTTQAVVPPPDGGYPNFTTAEGQDALFSLTTGVANTAVGWFSLKSDTDGSFNTGVGAGTLLLSTGNENTAVGAAALLLNTTGEHNTALGATALLNNTEGTFNTATGTGALSLNPTGSYNTATGAAALYSNTTGVYNTANGYQALASNTTGYSNTAHGGSALINSTTGINNTAIGLNALFDNTTGSNNTALGAFAGSHLTTGSGNIDINNAGVAGESDTIRIGNTQSATYIAGISGQTASQGTLVFINSDGKLGTMVSSRRFKKEIKAMDQASEAILALKPVSFQYKSDSKGTPQFGLIAEEVAKVNRALVLPDKEGKPYTVRYEAVNAMLLNEFLKEHRKSEKLEATVARQQDQIEALTAGLEKVTAQLEVNKTPPQIVLNNQ
jgi:hypothetical protein